MKDRVKRIRGSGNVFLDLGFDKVRAGRLAWLRDAWAAGAVVPLVCRSTIAEPEQVLFYPKFDLDVSVLRA
jgi:hypothetical protein